LRLLHGALHREERGRGGPGGTRARAARVRDRWRRPGVGHGAHRRHWTYSRRDDHRNRSRALQADAARGHGKARSSAADLQEICGLWTFRANRTRIHVGAHGQGGGTQVGSQVVISVVKRLVLTTAALAAAVVVFTLVELPPRPLALDASWADGTVPGVL